MSKSVPVSESRRNPLLNERVDSSLYFPEESLTKQCFQDECDINAIMKRYEKTGVIEHISSSPGHYGDFSDVHDYHTILNRIHSLQDDFMSLPAHIRARFENDPGQFIDFVRDPRNDDELVKMGVLPPAAQNLTDYDPKNMSPAEPAVNTAEGSPHSST